jgi:DNA repair protein RAD16
VDHPYLVVHSATGNREAAAATAAAAAAQGDDLVNGGLCGICHDPLEQPVMAGCGHAFCRVCLVEYMDGCGSGVAVRCPACQRTLSVDLSAASVVLTPCPAQLGLVCVVCGFC